MGVKLSRETARKEKPAHRSAPSQTQTKLLCGMLFSLPAFLVPFCLTNLQALVSQEAFTTLQVDWSPLQGSHPPLGSSSITSNRNPTNTKWALQNLKEGTTEIPADNKYPDKVIFSPLGLRFPFTTHTHQWLLRQKKWPHQKKLTLGKCSPTQKGLRLLSPIQRH